MAESHLKECSLSLAIRENVNHNGLAPVRTVRINKQMATSVGGDVGKGTVLQSCSATMFRHYGNQLGGSSKSK